ncbi:probable RNA-dependent RNA polymerase 5 isoform X1 [Primulina huaijiensis]|uniref:probable RNA-dependent RNA polymerase 5 isoform X1 n=1 Tax=Primulina huaijiensis TaxID=1492673 RepID=UPI003CC72D79
MSASSSNSREVPLPESVETILLDICQLQSQPPIKNYARRLLAEIGEQASMEILATISSQRIYYSLSGYIATLVKKYYPAQASLVLSGSQSSPTSFGSVGSPSCASPFSSPQNRNAGSQSPESNFVQNCTTSNLQRPGQQKIQLSLGDKTQERGCPSTPDVNNCQLNGAMKPITVSQQLLILSRLEFRKLFLVLSYIGRKNLEDVISLDDTRDIYNKKDLPMARFESEIWSSYGKNCCGESDRSEYFDWDSGKAHTYFCYIHQDGSYHFKGPYLNSTRTHLQRCLGDDSILTVKFFKDGMSDLGNISEGILVGLRRYQFFVFKDERKRQKKVRTEEQITYSSVKCYFVHIDSVVPCSEDNNYILYGKSVTEARGLFMHIHMVSTIEKYMARFSLILSKTIKLHIDFHAVNVEEIEDIPFKDENGDIIYDEDGKPMFHTDGTGFISEDLAMKCPKDFSAAMYIKDRSFETHLVDTRSNDPPLLMQCRLFYNGCAVKGTLLVNKKLERGTIHIRPSMIKVERDCTFTKEETFNSLEIVDFSRKPGRTTLSKNLIALLSYGNVPPEFFLSLLINALEDSRNVYTNRSSALRVASNNEGLQYGFLAQRMISSGIPLNEPYLQHCLWNLEKNEKSNLKAGKLPISETFYLMGTADPTGILNYDEVCVILHHGQVSGKVLVYRNPGLHFGDIHVMKAVYLRELEEVVGNAKYGIFFSTKGWRSAPYEMATGDFDGDMYWVSRNPELLEYYQPSDPWCRVYPSQKSNNRNPQQFSPVELECELLRLFSEARRPSFIIATAADSWLSFMDRLLTIQCASQKDCLRRKIIQLIDIYYDALDAPKSGKKINFPNYLKAEQYPHYMQRGADITYNSFSILGQIYNRMEKSKDEASPTKDIWKLPCFDVQIPAEYVNMWRIRYGDYRKDMTEALKSGSEVKNDAADEVIRKYKQMLYDAPDIEESQKNTEQIYEEALAIYNVTYDHAISCNEVGRCSFCWRVAGSALFDVYAWKASGSKEKPIVILPSVLREILQ